MGFRNLKLIASLLIVLIISACGNDQCVRDCRNDGKCLRECGVGHCVDADDWGYPKVWVPADGNDPVISGSLRGNVLNQYIDGIDSRQVILDADSIPLVITVGNRDQWSSWFGGDINTNDDGTIDKSGYDGGRTVPDMECNYTLTDGKSSSSITKATPGVFGMDLSPKIIKLNKSYDGNNKSCNPIPSPLPTPDAYTDCLVPCYMRHGMGLYVGLAPNKVTGATSDDVILAYHMPDAKAPDGRSSYVDGTKSSLGLPDATDNEIRAKNFQKKSEAELRDGYLVRGPASAELPGAQTGDRLFFKIVDRTYIDNSGGYHIKIKEGTRNADPGPLEKIVMVFVEPMNAVMVRVYSGIVSSHYFRSFIMALLALYLVFFGYNIMIGGPDALKKDVMTRIIKIGLIMTLISDSSWDFFYNHMFQAFIGGTQAIATMLMNPFGDFDPSNPWYSMDQALAKMWSNETWSKILATLVSNPGVSLVFIPGMLWGIVNFTIALAKALIMYLVMFAVIAIMIMMAPIFIMFMLFEKTKDLTKEWYDQIFVAALQQIILMVAIGMFSTIIVMYLQKTVGYTTCWNTFWDFKVSIPGVKTEDVTKFKFWMPDISDNKAYISADANNDGIKEPGEMAYRYMDAPYLDPVYDRDKLSQMVNYKYWGVDKWSGMYLDIIDLIVFIGLILLMSVFMELVETVAATLKAGSVMQTSNVFGSELGGAINNAIRGGKGGGGLVGGGLDFMKNSGKSFAQSEAANFIKRGAIGAGSMANNSMSRAYNAMPGVAEAKEKAAAKAEKGKNLLDDRAEVLLGAERLSHIKNLGNSQTNDHGQYMSTQNILNRLVGLDGDSGKGQAELNNLSRVMKNHGAEQAFAKQYRRCLDGDLQSAYTPEQMAAINKNLAKMDLDLGVPRSTIADDAAESRAPVRSHQDDVINPNQDLSSRDLQMQNAKAEAEKQAKVKRDYDETVQKTQKLQADIDVATTKLKHLQDTDPNNIREITALQNHIKGLEGEKPK